METPQLDITKPVKGTKRAALRRRILSVTMGLSIFTPLIFILAALGTKFGIWSWVFGLGVLTLKIGPLLLLLTGLFGLIGLILAGVIKPRKGFFTAGFALFIGLVGVGKLGATKAKVESLPLIHDVTTDTQNVPQFSDVILKARGAVKLVNSAVYKGKRDSRDNQLVSVLQTQAYPNIRTLNMSEDRKIIFGKAEAIASGLGWEIVNRDADKGVIEAVDTSFWYGFKDDIIIRLTQSDDGATLVDVRSLSRVGQSDLGKNAARIKSFLKKLKTN